MPWPWETDTSAQDAAMAAAAAAWQNQQKGSAGNSVAAPASQPYVMMPLPKGMKAPAADRTGKPFPPAPDGWGWFQNPGYDEAEAAKAATAKATAAAKEPTVFGSDETGRYILDSNSPNGVKLLVPAHTPNADDEMSKALDRYQKEALRTQRENNDRNGFGYATDDEVIKRGQEAQQMGISQKELALKYKTFDEQQRQFDITAKQKDAVDAANIGLTGAQTSRTGAETSQIQQNMDVTKAKLPGDLAQQQATLAGTQASTAATQQATQIAGAPKVQAPPTGMSQWTYDPKTGQVTQGDINPEYQAKTMAEVAARVGQIHSLMQQKGQEVQGKVGQTIGGKLYTAEDANTEFNRWYDQNVAPQQGALEQAQQAAMFTQAKDQAEMQRSAYQTALGAGTQSINAFNAEAANRAGPGLGAAMKSIAQGRPQDVDFNAAMTYQAPSVSQQANDAVNQALKHISPAAAQGAGVQMPNFQNIDIGQMLNRTNAFQLPPGGAPGMGMGVPQVATPQAVPVPQSVPIVPASPDQWQQFIPNYPFS